MKKIKKPSSLIALISGWILAIILVVVVIYLLANPIDFRNRSQEVQQFMISVDKYNFIMFQQTGFEIQLTLDGETIQGFSNVDSYVFPLSDKFDPRFNELVIVRTQEEAEKFPDNVVVAWLINEEWWDRYFYAVNWAMRLDEEHVRRHINFNRTFPRPIGIAEFEERVGLTYPIDADDMLNNFEQFSELIFLLIHDGSFIRAFADQSIMELPPPNWQQAQPQKPTPTTDEANDTAIELTKPQQQLIDKFNYAYNFYFQFADTTSVAAKIDPTNPAYSPSYTNIILFHTAEEAKSAPGGTIAAWLPEEKTITQFIHMIHSALSFTENELDILGEVLREELTLEQFGLSYPLQPSDLVDNWEKANDLWNALKPIEHYAIRAFALREAS